MIFIHGVIPLKGLKILLQFKDGEEKLVNLLPLHRKPIFDPIRQDPVNFRTVHVDEKPNTIYWDNEADIDPGVLYGRFPPGRKHRKQKFFPVLRSFGGQYP